MALPHQKQSSHYLSKALVLPVLLMLILLQSCTHEKKIYQSNCNDDKSFTRITFNHLMDSLDDYDQEYVEVSGKYIEDKDLSALFNDSLFVDHSNKNALWVDFSQECPLYLSGTHTGLFEYNDGSFTQINNKSVTIRGMIVFHPKKKYKATLERISLVKL